jgi:hypothetical protein
MNGGAGWTSATKENGAMLSHRPMQAFLEREIT